MGIAHAMYGFRERDRAMKHLFLPERCLQGGVAVITGDALHYLKHVRRMHQGQSLQAVIGNRRYTLIISAVEKERIICAVEKDREVQGHGLAAITVFQGLLKQRKMDLVVGKLAELGVETLVPLVTARTVPQERSQGKQERWERLALEGAKVSGAQRPMTITGLQHFQEALKGLKNKKNGVIILFCTEVKLHLKPFLESLAPLNEKVPGRFSLFFGPEGGFTAEEVELFRERGGVAVSMGPLVFRSETAAIVGTGFLRLFTVSRD
jgi:16S rRNA (uracil1498-N3)-methyltransferase